MEFEEKPEGSGSLVDENQLDLGEKHQANRKPGASGKAKLSARQQANAKCDLPRKSLNRYTWQEIQRHNQKTDQWLVINRKVYDVTGWADRHPGGRQVLKHYAGEDATDVFRAMHPDPDIVRLYLKPLLIGELAPEEPNQERNKNSRLVEDFQELRRTLETLNMFNANLGFFFLHLAQILILEALAWVIVWHFGSGWLITIFISFLLTVAQAQGSFLQHDMGHLSIFKKSKWNRLMHKFVMGHLKNSCLDNPMNRMKWQKDMTRKDEVPGKPFNITVIEVYAPNTNAEEAEVEWFYEDLQDLPDLKLKKAVLCIKGGWDVKGLSSKWWNNWHFQHHVKTNIYPKDPDIDIRPLFVIGDLQAVEYGKNRIKFFDYEKQHLIFCLVSPFVTPVYFNLGSILEMCPRRHWEDIAWAISFYIRYFITFGPFYGIFGTMVLIYLVKILESPWIAYVTQMSHISMKISKEENRDWFSSQVLATCNVEHSFFNDWFTGHVNFQIEHHLFPTMPRHNFHKVAPLVKSLCAKHGLPYVKKPMLKAFGDILRALKKYGALWKEAYCTHPEI